MFTEGSENIATILAIQYLYIIHVPKVSIFRVQTVEYDFGIRIGVEKCDILETFYLVSRITINRFSPSYYNLHIDGQSILFFFLYIKSITICFINVELRTCSDHIIVPFSVGELVRHRR